MSKVRISVAFGYGRDHEAANRAHAVLANLFEKPVFATPPVSREELAAALSAYEDALAAQATGGSAATAAKKNRREELVARLKVLALYVQTRCRDDVAGALSSGFLLVDPGNTQSPLPVPTISRIKDGVSGECLVTVSALRNARCYEVRFAPAAEDGTPGEWEARFLQTSSRNIRIPGLIPGRLHAFQVRGVGGSLRYSDWSDSSIHRAM